MLGTRVYATPDRWRRILEKSGFGPFSHEEARWRRADGQEILVVLTGRPVFGEAGDVTCFEVFVEDVTEERRKTNYLRGALDASGAFLFTLAVNDGSGPLPLRPVWINEAVQRVLGYSVTEALEPSWFYETLHPDDRERAVRETHSVLRRGHVVQEFRLRRRDGVHRWFRQEVRRVEEAEPESEIVGVYVDITERKEAEKALRESVARLDRVLEAAGAFLYILASAEGEYRFEWLSPGVRTLLGYTLEEAMAPGWFPGGLHPEDRRGAIRAGRRVQGEKNVVHEFRFRHRNGEYRWFREDLRMLDPGTDAPPRIVGVAVDVTARKRAEESAREGVARLRDLANAVPEGILTIDQEGRVRDLNPAAEEIYGYRRADLLGRPFTDLIPERYRARNLEVFRDMVSDDRIESFEARRMRGIRKSGEEFSAEVSVAEHVTGGATFVTTVVRDVSERRRIEEEREALIDELQVALREVRTLRGILPICSSCKSIRDDAGYWHRVEVVHRLALGGPVLPQPLPGLPTRALR